MTMIGSSFGDPGYSQGGSDGGANLTRTGTVVLDANVSGYQSQMNQAAQATSRVDTAVTGLSGHINHLFQSGGRDLKIFGAADAASLTAGVASVASLQSEMSTLNATAAVNRTSMTSYGRDVDNVFSKFPSHRGDVVALVTEITNLGVSGSKNITNVAEAATKLGAASGEAIPELTNDLVSLNRQMTGDGAQNIMGYANAVLSVSKNAGVSVTSVLQFSQAIAPISRQAGLGEAAVLGISTAFSKAGADGFVAANTFNSIVNDITTLTRTGSPELTKYASFLGLTVNQFRRMPAKDQITGIFDAIAKGGPSALNFVNELGLGTRALSAVQAVAQSGGLNQYIGQAESAQSSTGALNRGARAAMSGLDAQVDMVHNQITRFGDIVARPLLTPITALAHGFEVFLAIINSVVAHLGPLPGALALIGTVLLPLAGVALAHAPLIAAASAVRTMFNSGPRRAFNEGQANGALIAGGTTTTAATRADAEALAAGMPLRARAGYYAGEGFGRVFGPADPDAPGVGGMFRRVAAGGMNAVGGIGGWYMNTQSRALRDSTLSDYERSAYGPTSRAGFGDAWRNFFKNTSSDAEGGLVGSAVRNTRQLAGAGVRLAGNTIGAAGSMVGAAATSGLGRAGSALSAISGAAFSLPGILAMTAGVPLFDMYMHHGDAQFQQNTDVDDAVNAISKYDAALGQTSTNLARFNAGLNTATDSLTTGRGRTLTQVAQISAADIGRSSSSYHVTDPTLSSFRRNGRTDVSGAVSYIESLAVNHGGMDSQTLQRIKQDLIATQGTTGAQQVLSAYLSTNPSGTSPNAVNYAALGRSAGSYVSINGNSNSQIQSNRDLTSQAFSSIVGEAQLAPGRRSSAAEVAALLQFGGRSLVGANGITDQEQLENFRKLLAKTFGGSDRAYGRFGALPDQSTVGLAMSPGDYASRYGTVSSTQQGILRALTATSGGRALLRSAGLSTNLPTSAFSVSSLLGATFPGATSASANSLLQSSGPLGAALARNSAFQAATGADEGAGPTQKAIEEAAGQALVLGKNSSLASIELQKLADASGGATQQILQGAATWARTLQSQQLPYMSQAQQGSTLAANLSASRSAAMAPGASTTTVQTYQSDEQAYAQWQQSQQQRLLQIGQTVDQFRVSQERSEHDYELQVYRSNRNFQIQMVQSEQDYVRQRGRTLQDFNIQMARQAQSAAESIYNPFVRVQSQSVVNGGMLVGNLEDQNQRIEQQQRQVEQLRRAGLTQAAIDTLQLDNPNNAQDTNSIATSVIKDPKTIARINALIATRQRATTALTQSNYNEDFRNTVADFERGLDRTQQDYETAHDRAVEAQQLALSDMSTDFNTQVQRAGQDLTTQMTELYGTFANVYSRTMAKIIADTGKQFPKLEKMLLGQVKGIGSAVGSAGDGATGPSSTFGASGSVNNPITKAGTVGINPGGQLGSYSSSGKFTPYAGPRNPTVVGRLDNTHIANPKTVGHDSAQTPEGAQKYASARLAAYGWGQDQMTPLIKLWNNESGWRYTAYNNVSGATGIPQSLPGSKMASAGSDWATNGATQIEWGLGYIKGRYGSPAQASAFEFSHDPHWYAAGSIFTRPKIIGVGEAGPETVLPLNQRGADFMAGFVDKVTAALAARAMVAGRGIPGTGSTTVMGGNQYADYRTFYTGDIKLTAETPAQMERKLAARAKLRRLAQPVHAGN